MNSLFKCQINTYFLLNVLSQKNSYKKKKYNINYNSNMSTFVKKKEQNSRFNSEKG